ncbi:MAG: crotonase/enoyl-CoA hydratase family protein [Deinococcales bacterium]
MQKSDLERDIPECLALRREGALLIIGLNRPQKRNAIHDEMVGGLEHIFTHIPPDIRAIVLHGEGEHFSAGLDLSELGERDAFEGLIHSRLWHRAFERIQFGPVPVIAALHGAVIGGGLELAAATHIRIAEASTFYALPEGQRGIYVGGGASVRLPKLIGVARMMDMMLTGRVIRAEEGYQLGLSQYLVAEGEALNKALELAQKVANNNPITNFALIHALPRTAEASQEQGLMMEALMAAIAQDSSEAKLRLQQFLNKQAKKVGEA